jgi:3-phosphoglycerate kinase
MVGLNKKTVKDVKLAGKRVLLRADYNVSDLASDYRLTQSVPTIEYILKQKPKQLVIISHRGRPKGMDFKVSLQPVAAHLSKLLGKRVWFLHDCIGEDVKSALDRHPDGAIFMLENLRFHEQEEQNDPKFAKELVKITGADIFVQDGFGVVHRAHASTDAITKLLPSVAGLLLQKEVETISRVMSKPAKPLVAVIGGAKITDKIEVINKLMEIADVVALGGALANNFLKVQGFDIGKSLYDKDDLTTARQILKKAEDKARQQAFSLLLPVDAVVSTSADGRKPTRIVDISSHSLADIESYPKIPKPPASNLSAEEAIYDIGPISAAKIAGAIGLAKTVIWSGTLGVAEVKGIAGAHAPFAHGTKLVAQAIAGKGSKDKNKPYSLVGGGDTTAFIENQSMDEDFNHLSTGGSASLELMAGKKLPGVEALENKK